MPTLTEITIANSDFEDPLYDGYGWGQTPTGWTYTGNAAQMRPFNTSPHARHGTQHWIMRDTHTFSQTNLQAIEANTTYIFQAYCGKWSGSGTFMLEITANGTVVAGYEEFEGYYGVWPRHCVIWRHANTHTGQQIGVKVRPTLAYASGDGAHETAIGRVKLYKHPAPVFDWLRLNLDEMAEGEGRIIESFRDPWTIGGYDADRAPDLVSDHGPTTLFGPWPGAVWDEGPGYYWKYGRGHNSSGANDINRYDVVNNVWERCSLPSGQEDYGDFSNILQSKGGFDTGGPLGAHPLDSFQQLKLSRRLSFYSGGTYKSGYPLFRKWNGSAYVGTGPFLYDTTKVDRFKVGGVTGCGRYTPDQGTGAWSNRDQTSLAPFYWNGSLQTFQQAVVENSRDVVYTYTPSGATNYVVRHEIVDIATPANDVITQFTSDQSSFWYAAAYGCSCYDPMRRVIFYVGADVSRAVNNQYIAYLHLDAGTPALVRPTVSSGLSGPGSPSACYDSVRQRVVAIGGITDADCEMVTFAVPDTLTDTWAVANLAYTGDVVKSDIQALGGTFKYSRRHDCYLMPTKDHATKKYEMWVYKPVGWSPLPPRAGARRALM